MGCLWTAVLLLIARTSAEIQEFGEISSQAEFGEETERIIGGKEAEEGELPWVVALYDEKEYICAASIITPTAILTAAHCVMSTNSLVVLPASSFYAIIGNVNRSSPDAQQIFFSKVTPHPDFDGSANDLAILEPTEPIEFNDKVKSICITSEDFGRLNLDPVIAMGWGQTANGNEPNSKILKHVRQQLMGDYLCIMSYDRIKIPESAMCVFGTSSGICGGDSGGPLVYHHGWQPVQVGIASFRHRKRGCGSALGPAGFTRVGSFTDYIVSTASGKVCVI